MWNLQDPDQAEFSDVFVAETCEGKQGVYIIAQSIGRRF